MKILYDNLDDRREIYRLLSRLAPAVRVKWLEWCCKQVTVPNSRIHPEPSYRRMRGRIDEAYRHDRGDEVLVAEVYFDVWQLAHQYHLDLDKATAKLVETVRWAEKNGQALRA